MMRARSRVIRWMRIASLALVAWSFLAPQAHAQPVPPPPRGLPGGVPAPAPASARVSVQVMVVHATNQGNRIDPRLTDILQNLRAMPFSQFTSFTLLTEDTVQLQDGGLGVIDLAGGRKLKLDLLSHDDEQAKLRVRLIKDDTKLLDATISVHRNRMFTFAGPRYDEGFLILPVSVRY